MNGSEPLVSGYLPVRPSTSSGRTGVYEALPRIISRRRETLFRRLENRFLPARYQTLAALLRPIFVEVELDRLHVAGLGRGRIRLRFLVRWYLDLVDVGVCV